VAGQRLHDLRRSPPRFHTRTRRSLELVGRARPVARRARRAVDALAGHLQARGRALLLDVSQTQAARSPPAAATREPSPLIATPSTSWSGPVRVESSAPLVVSHSRTVLSREPVTARRPSAESAEAWIRSSWPRSCASGSPVSASCTVSDLPASQSRRRPSPESEIASMIEPCDGTWLSTGARRSCR
jgi:hypothetical protein